MIHIYKWPYAAKMVNFEHRKSIESRKFRRGFFAEIVLKVDELEAMRLSFLENLSQIDAASCMDVHQSTFQRMLKRAIEKVNEAFVNRIVKFNEENYKCQEETVPVLQAGSGIGRSNEGRRCNGRSRKPRVARKVCVYAHSVGYEAPHTPGVPCAEVNVGIAEVR